MADEGLIQIRRRDSDVSTSNTREWIHLLPLADRRDVEALERARRNLLALSVRQRETHAETLQRAQERYSSQERHSAPAGEAAEFAQEGDGRKQVTPLTLMKVLRGSQAEHVRGHLWSRRDAARYLYANVQYQSFQILLSALSCGIYVAETYVDLVSSDQGTAIIFWEIFIFLCFLFDFFVHLCAAEDPRDYLFSSAALVDVLALVPVMVIGRDKGVGFVRFFRVFKAARLLRIHRLTVIYEQRTLQRRRDLTSSEDVGVSSDAGFAGDTSSSVTSAHAQNRDLVHQVISLAIATLGVIFIASAVVHTIEAKEGGIGDSENPDGLAFHDAVYFVIVTITTVGYGDVVPVSTAARLTMAAIICAAIVIIPYQIKLLLAVLSRRSHHLGSYRRRHVTDRHLVLMGTITYESLVTSLRELFHPDHRESSKVHVVILAPSEPNVAILALIQSPAYRSRVTYVKGTPLNALDLARADVRTAAGVTILVNKQSTNAQKEDMGVVLRALSVANFCQESRRHGAGPRVFTELIQPQATRHLRTAGLRHVVCADALKLSLMANSCLCPGLSTLLVNLMRSHSVMPPDVLLDASWYVEYYIGATKQLYVVEFSPQLHHVRFDEAAALIFQEFELVLLGVYNATAEHSDGRVVLNPGHHYAIRRNDFAFVLADSARDAQHIWDYVTVTVDEEDEVESELARLLARRGPAAGAGADLVHQKLYAQQVLQTCKLRREYCSNAALIEEWNAISGLRCGQAEGNATAGLGRSPLGPAAVLESAAGQPPPPPPPPPHLSKRQESARSVKPAALGEATEDARRGPRRRRSAKEVLTKHLAGVAVSELSGDEARQLLQRIQAELPSQARPPLDADRAGHGEDDGGNSPGKIGGFGAADAAAAPDAGVSDVPDGLPQDGIGKARSDDVSWIRWKWGHAAENLQIRRLAAPFFGAAFEGRYGRGGDGHHGPHDTHRARHLLVIGMEPSMPHLDCLLRPFRTASAAWIWHRANPYEEDRIATPRWRARRQKAADGSTGVHEEDAVPVVFLARPEQVPAFCEALWRLGETSKTVAVIAGSPLSTRDLMRAGAHRAASVMLLARTAENIDEAVEETLVDSTVLVAFLKLLPLLRAAAHLSVELVYESNLRFLHPLHDKSVRRLQDLGDESSYLWPLAAAGKTFSVSSTDALMSQAFYRPPIIYFIEQLLDLSPVSSASEAPLRHRHRSPDARHSGRSHHKHHSASHRRLRSSEAESHDDWNRPRGRVGHMRAVGSLASILDLNPAELPGAPNALGTPDPRGTATFAETSALAEASSRDSGLGSAMQTGIYGRRPSRHEDRPPRTPRMEREKGMSPLMSVGEGTTAGAGNLGLGGPAGGPLTRLSAMAQEAEGDGLLDPILLRRQGSDASRRDLVEDGSQRLPSRRRSGSHQHAHPQHPNDDQQPSHHDHHHHPHHHREHRARIYMMSVPADLYQHSYGELYQELVAPPLNLVAIGLYRRAGTRNSVEPYVYTSPRADTVLHEGDRVFVLGEPSRQTGHTEERGPRNSMRRASRSQRSMSLHSLGIGTPPSLRPPRGDNSRQGSVQEKEVNGAR